MLSRGPVSLAPLAPYLEDFMDDPSWRFRIRFDDAVLSWEGWRKKLDLKVVGAHFMERDGGELISVPEMSVVLDSKALMAGRFRVSGLELIAPKLRLLRHRDGRIEITNNDGTTQPGAGSGFDFEPGTLGGEAGTEAFGDLLLLSVRGADLSFHDVASDLKLAVPSADLSLRQETDGVSMRLSTRLQIGQSEAALGISALYQDETTPIVAAVNFAEVDIAGLAKAIGGTRMEAMQGLAVVAAGRLDLAVLPDGVVDSLTFDVATGPGQIALPRIRDEVLAIAGLEAKGEFANNFSQLKLTDLQLNLGEGLRASAAGHGTWGEAGPAINARGRFVNFPISKLPLYWPADLGVDARKWVLENILGGLVTEGRFSVDIRPGDLEQPAPRPGMFRLDWKFQDASADYFGQLPRIEGANGSGFVDGLEYGLTVVKATAGGMQLSEGKLHIADLTLKSPVLDVEFVAHGAMADALALLDAKPLEFAKALTIRPADAGGTSATRARFRIPLSDHVTLEQVGFSAAANIAELSLPGIGDGYALTNGVFTLSVVQDGLALSGRGAVNGVPLQLDWKREFRTDPGVSGDHLAIRGSAGRAQWQALGLPAVKGLQGAVAMAVSIDLYDDGSRRGAGRFDLTGTALNWPDIGWNKPAAVPAEMNLTFQNQVNGALILDKFEFSGAGLQARGSAKFDADAGLIALASDNFVLGATHLMINAAARPGGGYRLDLQGPSLDLRSFVPRLLDGAKATDEPPLELNLKIDQVYLTNEVVLNQLAGTGQRHDGEWQSADIHAGMAGGQSIGFTVRPEGRGRRFIVIAGNAGRMARVLGLYSDARGGTMFLSLLVPPAKGPDDTIVGNLRADNFRVVKARVLTQLLTLGSLTGLGDVLNDKGITFTRLDVPFTMRRRQLHIEGARAVGPAMAVMASGDYGRDNEALRFQGTIVPSYTLNSVLGGIPILGELLIGRKGEGGFAFTYNVKGTLDNPKVSVNLLSALAPGFLRRIVEGLDDPAVGDVY